MVRAGVLSVERPLVSSAVLSTPSAKPGAGSCAVGAGHCAAGIGISPQAGSAACLQKSTNRSDESYHQGTGRITCVL